ncbi:hypothetical protein ACG9XW_07290 [Acinetobacter guillouiae]|uniref:DUF7710 domain-containing protein n=1 Tax=Acinetobacter guillouiae TaxID=106649 RepID=UPI003AF40D72
MDFKFIWMIQNSDNLNIIGCFTDKVSAEKYIYDHQLKCILTQYPLDISVYDWVIENGFWKPKSDLQKTGKFIGRFSSAYLEHEHFNQYDE